MLQLHGQECFPDSLLILLLMRKPLTLSDITQPMCEYLLSLHCEPISLVQVLHGDEGPTRRMLCWDPYGGCDVDGKTYGSIRPALSASLSPWKCISPLLWILMLLLNFFVSKCFLIPWLFFNPAGGCFPPSHDHCQANIRWGSGCSFHTDCLQTPTHTTVGDTERQETQ